MDLRANDLCEGIAQLAVKEFVVVEGSGELVFSSISFLLLLTMAVLAKSI